MSVYKIEQGVEIPDACGGGRPKYPLGKMAIGDSFFAPANQKTRVSGAAYTYGYRNSMKFMVRAEGDGVRVWRVE